MPEKEFPAIHHFPGGWSFFSAINSSYYGAFFSVLNPETNLKLDLNIYHSSKEDSDLPPTAILIPF